MIGRWAKPSAQESEEPKGFDAFELRLGDLMRGERATLAKSLLDVQRELKIKATYIAAIENADPTAFETPGFIAGYVRSYARYLGLDPEWAYEKFCLEGNFAVVHGMSPAASGAKAPKTSPKDTVSRDPLADPNAIFVPRGEAMLSKIEPGALGSVAVLCALILGIGYGGWSVLQEIQKVEFTPLDQAPGVVADLGNVDAGRDQIASAAPEMATAVPSADAFDRLYRPQALDVPVMVARDGPIAALDPGLNGGLGGFASTDVMRGDRAPNIGGIAAGFGAEGAGIQVVEADVPEVILFAVRASWVRVNSADGTVLFEKVLDAGERYVLPATEQPPLLRSGNAGGVYFAVNGEVYGPAGDGPSVVKNIALGVDVIKEVYQVANLDKDSALAEIFNVADAQAALLAPVGPTGAVPVAE
ncbi:MAG: hypothetical protein ACJA2X_001021 [Halocynthiibacter sp.]|jgi:hypothetical protein